MAKARVVAGVAGLLVMGGAGVMLVALVALPGPWWRGYVSEAGIGGGAYRWGLLLLALGVLLLGALRRSAPLLVAAVLAATSGLVACTDGCPLPPFEATTAADVVHTAASILGMAVLAGAMLEVRLRDGNAPARRLAMAALALTVPLGGALGLVMLFAGRGMVGAVLERVLLVVAVSWLAGTAAVSARRGS